MLKEYGEKEKVFMFIRWYNGLIIIKQQWYVVSFMNKEGYIENR